MDENVITTLERRGFVQDLTNPDLAKICQKPIKVYVGFDPTADSLHVGNLIGIMALAHFQRFGHTPVIVLGGATGAIGDPSGKSLERPLLTKEQIEQNIASIASHFEQVLDWTGNLPKPILLNNGDWYEDLSLIDFLRDVGKHFRVGSMLSKESVRLRLASEEGISFTEFSYQLIQGYDFCYLARVHDVQLQMGGSDQWGNITAGIELNRKLGGSSLYGLTWPLLTRSDGKKFGKTAGGAIWLLKERCSPYQFYQYFIQVPDADVIHLLKMLTFLDLEKIGQMAQEMKGEGYVANRAQVLLAEEVTKIIHGQEGLEIAQKVTKGAQPGKQTTPLSGALLREIAKEMPSQILEIDQVLGASYPQIAVLCSLLSSKGEAMRMQKNGGAYLNNQKWDDLTRLITKEDLIDQEFLLLGAGKKKKILVRITMG